MLGIFGIVTIVGLVFGAGAGAAHVAENGLKIDIPPVVAAK